MPGTDAVIEISALTRRFGAKKALDSVDVSVTRGAVYGLVGANGAGKTTLIRHIIGLLRAESGTVRVFGLDPVADPHRPPLVLLDEPSSGLDPIVRRDILGAIFRTMADEGRTVFFSSHLLDEVELVADHVTMMSNGRVVMSAPLRSMLERHRCLTIRFPDRQARPPEDSGALCWEPRGDLWGAIVDGDSALLRERLASQRAEVVSDRAATLDEIFVGHVGSRADAAGEV